MLKLWVSTGPGRVTQCDRVVVVQRGSAPFLWRSAQKLPASGRSRCPRLDCVTVKCAKLDEAAEYTKALRGRGYEQRGGIVEVIHRAAKTAEASEGESVWVRTRASLRLDEAGASAV